MVYSRIEELCAERGISLIDLAKKIDISPPGLYRSIKNESMKIATMEKIAHALRVPIFDFFTPSLIKAISEPLEEDIRKKENEISELKKSLEYCQKAKEKLIAEKDKLKDKIIEIQEKYIDQGSGSM